MNATSLKLPPAPEEAMLPYIDGEAIVIDKPAGYPVDRPRSGAPAIADWLGELRYGFHREPVPVHRLDTDTSGCLLLARNPKALARFNRAFADRVVDKLYVGIVQGSVKEHRGETDLPLVKRSTPEAGWRMVADPDDPEARPARTGWRVLVHRNGMSLISFRPETGRTHQIRVHAKEGIGLPLIGDLHYGGPDLGKGMMLHALTLTVPREGKESIVARAPFPQRFLDLGFTDLDCPA